VVTILIAVAAAITAQQSGTMVRFSESLAGGYSPPHSFRHWPWDSTGKALRGQGRWRRSRPDLRDASPSEDDAAYLKVFTFPAGVDCVGSSDGLVFPGVFRGLLDDTRPRRGRIDPDIRLVMDI
jgi:hypothetical protein